MPLEIIEKGQERAYADKFEPGVWGGAILAATMVENSLVAFHGPTGCSIYATHYRADNIPAGTYTPILSSGIHEPDVIHGGTKKLEEAIKDVIERNRKRNPQLVWVFTSDSTSMVGDDIFGASQKVEKETGIKVIPVDTPAFRGSYHVGADLVYRALIDNYVEKGVAEKNRSINVIGPFLTGSRNWLQDFLEIRRLLEAADVKINTVLTFNNNLGDIRKFGQAEANYILTSETLPEVERISKELGIENYGEDLVLPFGIANTEEWYLKIAEKFGDKEKAKKQLKEEMDFLKRRLQLDYNASWFFHDMFGKRCGIIGQAPFAVALARCLFYDFNARPAVVGILADSERAINSAKTLLGEMADNLDFELHVNPTLLEYGLALKEAKVHFSIGQGVDRWQSEGLGIPNLPLGGTYFLSHFNFIPWPYVGIRGVLNLMTEFAYLMDKVKDEGDLFKAQSYIDTYFSGETGTVKTKCGR